MRVSSFLLALAIATSMTACDGDGDVEPVGEFEGFMVQFSAGLCMAEVDCDEFIELRADGLLRYDAFGEMPVVIHEATVSQQDLDMAVALLTDDALVVLLQSEDALCQPPTDIFEQMRLTADGAVYQQDTTGCDNPPLQDARALMDDLAATYFPAP